MPGYKAPKPGEMPPVVILRPGDVRTVQIDLVPILRQHELACGATCDGAQAARTRFGNTLELTISSPIAGDKSLSALVCTYLGGLENTIAVPVRVTCR